MDENKIKIEIDLNNKEVEISFSDCPKNNYLLTLKQSEDSILDFLTVMQKGYNSYSDIHDFLEKKKRLVSYRSI